MRNHKELDAYKISMDLVTNIYLLTKKFPKEELYGLTNQIRRAAVSVPANISEGAARHSSKEYTQFLYISLGSITELETLMNIAFNIAYIDKFSYKKIQDQIEKIRALILGLIRYIKSK